MSRNRIKREFPKCLRCGTTEKDDIYHTYCRACFLYIVKESRNESFVFWCSTCGNFFRSTHFSYECRTCDEAHGWRLSKRKSGETYIYLATDGSGLVKIGRTKDPEKRLSGLKTSNPKIEYLITFLEGNNFDVEKALHQEYKRLRIVGEWFKLDHQNILEIIEKYCSDQIPIYAFPLILARAEV